MANFSRIANSLFRIARDVFRTQQRESRRAARRDERRGERPPSRRRSDNRGPSTSGYPGDYTSRPRFDYSPVKDDKADPGEVVWTWVPYEEDHSQGKDRPVLVIGHDNQWLLALQLTSQDHDRDADQEERAGRHWMDIGSGDWDNSGRPSEVRVNRILRLDPDQVRRTGGRLAEQVFHRVAQEVAKHY